MARSSAGRSDCGGSVLGPQERLRRRFHLLDPAERAEIDPRRASHRRCAGAALRVAAAARTDRSARRRAGTGSNRDARRGSARGAPWWHPASMTECCPLLLDERGFGFGTRWASSRSSPRRSSPGRDGPPAQRSTDTAISSSFDTAGTRRRARRAASLSDRRCQRRLEGAAFLQPVVRSRGAAAAAARCAASGRAAPPASCRGTTD